MNQRQQLLEAIARLKADQLALGLPADVTANRVASGILALVSGGLLVEPIVRVGIDEWREFTHFERGPLVARQWPQPPLVVMRDLAWELDHPGERLPLVSTATAIVGDVTRTAMAFLDAGSVFVEGDDASDSSIHPRVQELAVEHTNWMARNRVQNHANFNRRFERVMAEFGSSVKCSEIVAQSWPWEDSVEEAAPSPWKAWKHSPGHWSVASVPHRFIGAEMLQGRNGIWYACILAVD